MVGPVVFLNILKNSSAFDIEYTILLLTSAIVATQILKKIEGAATIADVQALSFAWFYYPVTLAILALVYFALKKSLLVIS